MHDLKIGRTLETTHTHTHLVRVKGQTLYLHHHNICTLWCAYNLLIQNTICV